MSRTAVQLQWRRYPTLSRSSRLDSQQAISAISGKVFHSLVLLQPQPRSPSAPLRQPAASNQNIYHLPPTLNRKGSTEWLAPSFCLLESILVPRPQPPPPPPILIHPSLLPRLTRILFPGPPPQSAMFPRNPAGVAATAAATTPHSSNPHHHAIPLVSAPPQTISPAMSVSQGRSASGGVESHALEDDIPLQYTIDKLHSLGRYYWHKPETTDCCIRPYFPYVRKPPPQSP